MSKRVDALLSRHFTRFDEIMPMIVDEDIARFDSE